jgi:hypothetical protein
MSNAIIRLFYRDSPGFLALERTTIRATERRSGSPCKKTTLAVMVQTNQPESGTESVSRTKLALVFG